MIRMTLSKRPRKAKKDEAKEVSPTSDTSSKDKVKTNRVSSDRGGVSVGRDVWNSSIKTTYKTYQTNVQITSDKLSLELLELLKQKKGMHILYPPNSNFTGRDKLLADLRADLQLTPIKALTGLGGIGKTQLALEYSYHHQDDYDIVWWMHSELSSTLLDDYALMASTLKLPGWDTGDLNLLASATRSFLETHSRWLLVFDNAQGPEDIKPYLPHGGRGHVIITSRNPVWGSLARSMVVSKFERSESVKFLCKRTGQEDKKAADELAEALGDLPLALEQAGAYMETTAKPLAEYLRAFQERELKMLAKGKPSDYPDTVAKTWRISFEAVEKEYPAAIGFLQLFSYLAPDDIPLEYLIKGSGQLPDSISSVLQDEDGRDEALAALRRYSLISIRSDKISVHRLVQAVTRDAMNIQEQKVWAGTAVKLLDDAFPKDHIDNVESWPECSDLLPHALAAAGYAEELDVEPEATGRLLNESGLYLQMRGEFVEARDVLKRSLEIREKALGPDHPDVAWSLNYIGEVLNAQADLEGAMKYHKGALKIREKALGPDHPDVAWSLNNIGVVLRKQGDPKGAREYHEKALKIWEKANGGPEHRHVAWAINNIGLALLDLGELQEARKYLEIALKIKEKVYGPDSPDVSMSLNDIGEVLNAQGDLEGAMKYHKGALKIREKALGPDHPDVAWSLQKIGLILQSLRDYEAARKCYERALKICQEKLGPDHPSTGTVANNLKSLSQD